MPPIYTPPIYLIGLRASGKTSLGKLLSQRMNLSFFDTDFHLKQKYKESVSETVEKFGWDKFRERESQALRDLTAPNTIIATGGGMVLAAGNREFMRKNGLVIYLFVPVDILVERLEKDEKPSQRPAFSDKGLCKEVQMVFEARKLLYEKTAHKIVAAERDLDSIASELIEYLGKYSKQ